MIIKDTGTKVQKLWGEETWFFSDREEVPSKVLINGTTVLFSEIIEKFLEIEGYDRFPILVKILKTKHPTSIQVHPSDEDVKKLGEQDVGKEEMWVILSDTGKVLLGIKEYQRNIFEMLDEFSLKRLDVVNVPSGTVHSIKENTLILEVSTNSNITYRIYDWERNRELHIEKAKEVIKIKNPSELLLPPLDKKPFENPFFRVKYLKNQDMKINTKPWKIIVCISGKGYVHNDVLLHQGEAVLILPDIKETLLKSDSGEFVLISPGEHIK